MAKFKSTTTNQNKETETHPRLDKYKSIPHMTEEQINQVEAAVERVGKVIEEIKAKNRYSNENISEILSDYLPSAQAVSRLLNHTPGRYPTAALLFAIRYVFGVDLNALADGGKPLPEIPREWFFTIGEWYTKNIGKKDCQKPE